MLKRLSMAAAIATALASTVLAAQQPVTPSQPASKVTAIRAGRLVDPETGTAAANQIILVRDGKVAEVGPAVAIPAGAEVVDLSKLTVLPGLVDAHNHLR